MKILIVNSVPMNTGDHALLEALIFGIKARKENVEINVLCNDLPKARALLNEDYFDWDLERAPSALRRNVEKKYLEADLIIASPGSYFHDFYDWQGRFKSFQYAVKLNKKIVLFCQSIGPFWKKENFANVRTLLSQAHGVVFRESYSFSDIKKNFGDIGRYSLYTDIAFLLHFKYPDLLKEKELNAGVKRVVLNFRNWKTGKAKIIQLGRMLCRFLIDHFNIKITFLSTCQGVSGYVNDAYFSDVIKKSLPERYQSNIEIIEEHFTPREFIEYLSDQDAYIGMRLHGAILSMLGGTPAFCIGYEAKSDGIFQDMGMPENTIQFDSRFAKILDKIKLFLSNYEDAKNSLPAQLKKVSQLSQDSINELFQ